MSVEIDIDNHVISLSQTLSRGFASPTHLPCVSGCPYTRRARAFQPPYCNHRHHTSTTHHFSTRSSSFLCRRHFARSKRACPRHRRIADTQGSQSDPHAAGETIELLAAGETAKKDCSAREPHTGSLYLAYNPCASGVYMCEPCARKPCVLVRTFRERALDAPANLLSAFLVCRVSWASSSIS
jgi:hypothetical protein